MTILRKAGEFIRKARVEAMKINWPSRGQVARYTLIVLGVSAIVAILLGTLDSFFGWLFRTVILGM